MRELGNGLEVSDTVEGEREVKEQMLMVLVELLDSDSSSLKAYVS